MRLETAALRFMYMFIYLTLPQVSREKWKTATQCYTQVPKQDCANVMMLSVAKYQMQNDLGR